MRYNGSMNKSISLYKDLLIFAKSIREDYLKNVPTFENQFLFGDLNESCYAKMYEEVKATAQIPTTMELYKEIPGLEEMYKRARRYYLVPRNRSVKGLDVQLGNRIDDALIGFLNSMGIKTERADLKNKRLPDLMVLDKTRNIKAYIEVKYHNAPFMLAYKLTGREPYEGSVTLDTDKVKRQIVEIESELDRPVFFVHWIDFPDLKGIFFNTHEQIKDYLRIDPDQFNRKERSGDYKVFTKVGYTEKFYPPLHEMGDLAELVRMLKD